jgi:hypothetical protein
MFNSKKVAGFISYQPTNFFTVEPCFLLDRMDESWFNIEIMRQINCKNTGNWWWPVG